jgi:hypothetical protein
MANQLYPISRQNFLTAQFDWVTNPIAMLLLDTSYVFDEAHENLIDIPVPSRAAAPWTLALTLAQDGFADGAAAQFIGLVWPTPISQVVLFHNTGDEATSTLIAYYDQVLGLPLNAVGGNYAFFPDQAFGGYFRL